MFKEDKYEQVFSNQMNNQNIQAIRKFFIFQPTHQQSLTTKQYTSLNSKKGINPLVNNKALMKKGNTKFTAGFQGIAKNNDQPSQSSMVVKSKKAPANQLSSFLLGLTGKIKKQTEQKVAQSKPEEGRNLARTSPQRKSKSNYSEVMNNLNKIRKQSNRKLNFQYYSHNRRINNEFPKLQRKNSDQFVQKTHSITPSLQYQSQSPVHPKSHYQVKQSYTQQSIPNKLSIKILKASEDPNFKKGFMIYHKQAKQFLQENIYSLDQPAQLSIKATGITAQNYLIIDRYSLKVILQKHSDELIEIASLTKIMTCYLCLLACTKYEINIQTYMVRVTDKAAEMPGTSAQLQAGDMLTIHQLLYGLMLPSGNDASVAIAESVGKIIQKYKYKQTKRTYYETFITHMNLLAKELGIEQQYQNSSGLSLNPNFSTPKAIALLSALAMRHKTFTEIVNTKQYEVEIKNQRFGLSRKQRWKNTNKLLWRDEGWKGVKTGTTETAGHCLMSCRQNYLISVYNCDTLSKRFSECNKLYELVHNQL